MKLSLWYNGHHVELEGTKEQIMDFLDNLKQPEITFTGLPNGTVGDGTVKTDDTDLRFVNFK